MEFFKHIRHFAQPGGRITRRQFWLGHAAILATTVLFSLVAGFTVGIFSTIPGLESLTVWGPAVIGGIVGIFALGAELLLAIKRMHDRGSSGVWVVIVVAIAFITNLSIGGSHVAAGENPITPLTLALTVFTAIMGGWLILELGFLRGTDGDNSYGADPLGEPDAGKRKTANEAAPLVLTEAMVTGDPAGA